MTSIPDESTRPDGADWLEQALRAEGIEHRAQHVPDDGFTARVMLALPRAATLPAWRKPVLALLWTVAAIAAAVAIPGAFEDVFRGAVAMFVGHRVAVADVAGVLVVLGAATWGALVYAMRTE
ncbi:MAG: hypothetical protein ABI981_05735 [Betaproteobacteria bacterium]